MTPTVVLSLCLFFVLLPFAVMLTIVANTALANYRAWKRSGRAVDPGDRDVMRLAYVTLMVAMWLGGL